MRVKKGLLVALLILLVSAMGVWGSHTIQKLTQPQIRISSNPWVGFTPFMYAQEKGWLKNTPFRFLWFDSLSENQRLYERGFTQGFTATQYEMLRVKDHSHLTLAFLIDRSNGADAVLSNRSLEELRADPAPIRVFLERGSLQRDLFNAFVTENGLAGHAFDLVNTGQSNMLLQKPGPKPVILLSYAPYMTTLREQGFKVIASTRSLKSFAVIDGLFVNRDTLRSNRSDFIDLKKIFNRALEAMESDPKGFYETVHGYLEGETYAQFMASVHNIYWLNGPADAHILKLLGQQDVSTNECVR